jgi:HlyD family secretion protein
MKTYFTVIIAATMMVSCRNNKNEADAYGNFESTEVIVSAETSGRIIRMEALEGSVIEKGAEIALIDTTMFNLQRAELDAAILSIKTKINSINAQNEILDQQISNLNVNVSRIEKMLKDDAATKKQYDDITGQVDVLKKQILANNTQKVSTTAEIAVYASKRATLNEQILRCRVLSPLKGTILEKYSEQGELAITGKPLVKIADLSLIKLRVYVSGAQLGKVKLGQECKVRTDDGKKGYYNFTGTVGYVSEKAEFTPKIIQTKDERVTLVYAVTIDVKNDGTLKSGMPGEAIF